MIAALQRLELLQMMRRRQFSVGGRGALQQIRSLARLGIGRACMRLEQAERRSRGRTEFVGEQHQSLGDTGLRVIRQRSQRGLVARVQLQRALVQDTR